MKKRTLIFASVLLLGTAGAGTALLLPRFLVQQATQKPNDTGEFITAPPPEIQLEDKISQAIQQDPPETDVAPGFSPVENPPAGSQPEERSLLTQPKNRHSTYLPPARAEQELPPARSEAGTPITPDRKQPDPLQPPTETHSIQTQPESNSQKASAPTQAHSTWRVKLSETEIAGMIYNGMSRNINAAYRPAFKGVSVRLHNGRGNITVALEPRHLPPEMLQQLPGVDRSTPVIYIGGEVGLDFDSQTVYPVIHNVSLGNLKIPYGAIKAMIKYEVHRQIGRMIQPASGQQVTLTGVDVNNGFLTISGQVR